MQPKHPLRHVCKPCCHIGGCSGWQGCQEEGRAYSVQRTPQRRCPAKWVQQCVTKVIGLLEPPPPSNGSMKCDHFNLYPAHGPLGRHTPRGSACSLACYAPVCTGTGLSVLSPQPQDAIAQQQRVHTSTGRSCAAAGSTCQQLRGRTCLFPTAAQMLQGLTMYA